MEKKENKNDFRINYEPILPTLGILFFALLMETILLFGLNVYGTTKLGVFLLLQSVFVQGLWLLFLSMAALVAVSNLWNDRTGKIAYYLAVILIFFSSVLSKLYSSLELNVSYTWIISKTGLDMLGLKYLHGWTIIMTIVIAIIILFSDLRIAYRKGKDEKYHLYAHSKVISILRLVFTDDRTSEIIGNNADFYIVDTNKPETKKVKDASREEMSSFFERNSRYETAPNKGYFNDLVRLFSIEFFAWNFIKLILAIFVAGFLADGFANQYLVIDSYLKATGGSWFGLASNYLHIAISRMSLNVNTPLDFGIVNAPTFEFLHLVESVVFILVVIWTIRISLAIVGEILVAKKTDDAGINARNIISNVLALFVIWEINVVLSIPAKVFIATTPYEAAQTTLWFLAWIALAIVVRMINPEFFNFKSVEKWIFNRTTLKVLCAVFFVILLLSPSIVAMFTVNRYIEGKREEYVWKPGNLPSIAYTKWSHEIDITRLNYTVITMPNKDILGKTRIFSPEAARLYMKPYVGANNWMSINNANVDIIYLGGGEKYTSILTINNPQYDRDIDVWRAKHVLQTHSEKILMIDAATTEPVDAQKYIGGNTTPTFYYGVGGLWKEVDEVYLEIPGFSETHLPEYKGPMVYNDRPDYVYSGFWRVLHFFFVDWNYAFGNYGDIKTLTKRDTYDRVSSILLPGMEIEPSAQPVFDGKGNIYELYWINLRHKSPHEYADYPEGNRNDVIRRFAVVLVNTKNGEIQGFNQNTDKVDYLLTYYRSFYPNWNNPMPDWLIPQLRYPETFFEEQINTYNWYFQDNFQKYQRNEFYELTLDDKRIPMEDVRYIMMPFKDEIIWTAERPVEWYKGATRNLAGMYLAPGGNRTGELYFIDFESKTIIGPAVALGNMKQNTEFTKHPYFPQWVNGNILLYSSDSQYYVIPYYKEEEGSLLLQAIAVVNAETRASGFYIIKDPQNYKEISKAVEYAFKNIGATVSVNDVGAIQTTITNEKPTGTTEETYVVILIKGGNGEIIKRIPIGSNETVEIVQNK